MMPPSQNKPECWFIFQNDQLVSRVNGPLELTNSVLITHLKPAFIRQHTLGYDNEYDMYCAELPSEYPLPVDMHTLSLRKTLQLMRSDWYEKVVRAYSIINWDKNHQYCGRCAHPTLPKPGTVERICPACSLIFYPRISPSIIVLIYKDDFILMARSPHFAPGVYGLIAGFVEAGENVEMAVHREVKEEVNIQIKDLRYFGSQAWPFPDSLMLGFIAEYAKGDLINDPHEIETADWYHKDHLPGRPSQTISMSSKLIDHFIKNQHLIKKS